jgi:hypothetical protein
MPEGSASVAHEAFEFPGCPVQRLFHCLALEMAHRHLGLQRLDGDRFAELVRCRRAGDRQDLVVVGIGIVIERARRRPLKGPSSSALGPFAQMTTLLPAAWSADAGAAKWLPVATTSGSEPDGIASSDI